jgi:tetratricopeptide (TPR) repeat protein
LAERAATAEKSARGFSAPVDGLAQLSRLYHANGFFDEALLCYEGLQRVRPHEARWPHLAASILANYGRLDEAQPLYTRAVALAPGYLPSRLRLGDVLLKANRTTDAARVYTDVLALNADNPYALLGLARCALAADDWGKAREQLQRAIAANPEFIGGLSLLATIEEHSGRLADADAIRARVNKREHLDVADPWLDGLLDDCYDPYRLSVAAAVASFRADTATAERYLLRAIEFSPAPAAYYRQLANLYVGMQNLESAKRSFERATALAPTDSDAWALYVKLLNDAGDRPAAYRTVTAGLAKCPDSPALHYAYGHMLHEDGRYPQALAELQQAKRLRPSEANAYLEIAAIHFRAGEIEAGLEQMRAVLDVQPDHPAALLTLANVAIERGDAAEARALIRRSRLQPKITAQDLGRLTSAYRQKFGQLP